jgi:two-component system, OmpR family, response regulator
LKRILIIDDEKDLCELIKVFPSSKGYDVDCANRLADAHIKWNANPPALVLLDNNLPDGIGLDMLEANLSLLSNTRIKTVFNVYSTGGDSKVDLTFIVSWHGD